MRNIYFCLLFLFFSSLCAQSQTFSYPDILGKPGFNLIDSKPATVQVRYAVPAFSLEDQVVQGTAMKYINLPGAFLFNDEGMPNLPGKGKYIAIPQGATPKIKIVSQLTETIHNVEIAPAPRIPLDNDNRPVEYKSPSFFTSHPFGIGPSGESTSGNFLWPGKRQLTHQSRSSERAISSKILRRR